jgi:hypothetical protein
VGSPCHPAPRRAVRPACGQDHAKGPLPGGRVVPVQVQRRLHPGAGQHADAGLAGQHPGPLGGGQPPPLLATKHTQRHQQGLSHQVDRVLHPARPPQRAGIQRRPELPGCRPPRLWGVQLHGPFQQPPVQLRSNQPGAEADQGALGERRLGLIHPVQHQLPAPVHHGCLKHFVIGAADIGLQDGRQRQQGWRHRRLAQRPGSYIPASSAWNPSSSGS